MHVIGPRAARAWHVIGPSALGMPRCALGMPLWDSQRKALARHLSQKRS